MKDQYGNPIPELSVMPVVAYLTADQLEQVDALPWYEWDGLICAPAYDLARIAWDTEPAEDYARPGQPIFYIDRPLHRYNEEDGFYHA